MKHIGVGSEEVRMSELKRLLYAEAVKGIKNGKY